MPARSKNWRMNCSPRRFRRRSQTKLRRVPSLPSDMTMDGSRENVTPIGVPQAPAAHENIKPQRQLRERLRLPLMLLGPVVVAIGAAYIYFTGGRFETTD